MTKQVKTKEEMYLEFSDDELKELGIERGDKFTVDIEDGKITLTPFATLEMNLNAFSREELVELIVRSEEKNQSVSDTMVDILTEFMYDFENEHICT